MWEESWLVNKKCQNCVVFGVRVVGWIAMLKIAITGGCGFVAQHFVKHLQDHCGDEVDFILTLDKKRDFNKYLDYPESIPSKHVQLDLTDGESLKECLSGINVVFHLAKKRLELIFDPKNEHKVNDSYISDNITATESVLDAMLAANVEYLVFQSDAYCNLPVEDNFGLNEDNHPGIGDSFVTGSAGEAQIRAEMLARSYVGRHLSNGKQLKGTFPRPVFLYGEGDTHVIGAFKKIADANGQIPNADGSSSGMFQYIYAGNFASMMYKTMKTLISNPEKCNGDFFYCMDETKAYKTPEFLAPILEPINVSFKNPQNCHLLILSNIISDYKDRFLGQNSNVKFSLTAFRFLFCYAYGFSNRKEQLTINHQQLFETSEAVERTAKWCQQEYTTNNKKLEKKHDVLRMG